jgi:hypothetical protein
VKVLRKHEDEFLVAAACDCPESRRPSLNLTFGPNLVNSKVTDKNSFINVRIRSYESSPVIAETTTRE